MPDFVLETEAGAENGLLIAGIDEVGRGPLAGPVVAAALCITPDLLGEPVLRAIDDSKKLTSAQRAEIAPDLQSLFPFGIGIAEVVEIDRVNILQATYLAMTRAVEVLAKHLGRLPDACLVDGNRVPAALEIPARPVVKGDMKALSIAAASVIAKVHRDGLMTRLAESHPGYGWERNAGYGTAEHLAALSRLGVTPHHRRSFRPVREAVLREPAAS